MDPEQIEMAKELLALRQRVLKESLNGKGEKGEKGDKGAKNVSELPQWVTEIEPAQRKKMLKAVESAIERLGTDDFGFCSECYISMPWADISRIPEREVCDSCMSKSTSQRLKARTARAARKVKAAK